MSLRLKTPFNIMNNRIEEKFKELRRKNKKALIAFITAGDPDLRMTHDLVLAIEKSGADIIELGVPFSDPLADGPTIQASSFRALLKGASLKKILKLVKDLRQKTNIPIALMTYYNPVFHYGDKRFVHDAVHCGVDGIIVPDLPPEEAGGLIGFAKEAGLATVFFLAPTTTPLRVQKVVRASTGFVYFVSLTGVTGARKAVADTLESKVREAKRKTSVPICVGFGVSTPQQVKAISRFSDGVIVGSAIINEIQKSKSRKAAVLNVSRFIQQLKKAM